MPARGHSLAAPGPAICGFSKGAFFCDSALRFARQIRFKGKAPVASPIACVQNGYRSLAHAPSRNSGPLIGTIHFADTRPDRFLPEIINYIESIAPLVGEAIYRFRVEESLQESETRFREREILGRHSDPRPRRYWIQYRTLPTWVSLFDQGVQLHWSDVGDELNSLWLDPTPGSRGNFSDAVLLHDRTFADPAAEVYLTPVARGGTGADRWFDVAVMLEPASANDAPSLSVSASALQVAPGQLVDISATAQDPNGDSLAYFWDLTEGQSLARTGRGAPGAAPETSSCVAKSATGEAAWPARTSSSAWAIRAPGALRGGWWTRRAAGCKGAACITVVWITFLGFCLLQLCAVG